MYDLIVVGGGAAGTSAALTARSRGKTVAVVANPVETSSMYKAERMDNFPGMPSVSGREMAAVFRTQLEESGAELIAGRALSVVPMGGSFGVAVANDFYESRAVILAVGITRERLYPGEAEFLGRGVSYCATCDAFFYRGKDVAVVGSGEYALHEVQALLPVAASVTLLLNGAPLAAEFPPEVTVRPEKIDAILGEQKVTGVQLSGGDVVELAGVFVALGVAGSTALARKIGAAVENDRIVTDEKMQTTVPGLYAAGDCTGGLLQVAKAVYEGALAGTEAAKALRKE